MSTAIATMLSKPLAEKVRVPDENLIGFQQWEAQFQKWNKLRSGMASGFSSETKTLKASVDQTLEVMSKATTMFKLLEALQSQYAELDPKYLWERDSHGMPYLFPINIQNSEETMNISFEHRENGLHASLYFPTSWISVFWLAYSDLGRGLIHGADLIKLVAYKIHSNIKVKFESIIPEACREEIWRAISLVGSANVFLIVDCTGVKPSVEYSIVPDTDPVVVAIHDDHIFHVTDFDTTAAEAMFALSTPEEAKSN